MSAIKYSAQTKREVKTAIALGYRTHLVMKVWGLTNPNACYRCRDDNDLSFVDPMTIHTKIARWLKENEYEYCQGVQ